jgi:hypothetical protein
MVMASTLEVGDLNGLRVERDRPPAKPDRSSQKGDRFPVNLDRWSSELGTSRLRGDRSPVNLDRWSSELETSGLRGDRSPVNLDRWSSELETSGLRGDRLTFGLQPAIVSLPSPQTPLSRQVTMSLPSERKTHESD